MFDTLADNAVVVGKTDLGASSSETTGTSTTTSTSYTSTLDDGITNSVTVITNTSALVTINGFLSNSGGTSVSSESVQVSGATTISSSDNRALQNIGNVGRQGGMSFLLTDLTPGSNTFTLQYRASAGTSTFAARRIGVIPL